MNQLADRQREYNVKEIEALKPEAVVKFLCPNASPDEALIFVKFCKAEGLNPFLREAHLIKYGKEGAASIVVGIDTFIKRATRNADYNGYKAGLIVTTKSGNVAYKDGAFYLKELETIVGAWAEVYAKNRAIPTRVEVVLDEYERDTRIWREKKATMIVKVPTAQAFKKTFPEDIGSNIYEFSEIDVNDTRSPNEILPPPDETVEPENAKKTDEQLVATDLADRIPTEPKLLEAWNTAMSKRLYMFIGQELKITDKAKAKEQVETWLGLKQGSIQSMKEIVCDPLMLRDLNYALYNETKKVCFK
jgi:phage recombination protein Bet